MTDNSFSIDVAAIRDRARQKMDRGPVTEDYGADPAKVVEILNEVLATEIGGTDVTTRRLGHPRRGGRTRRRHPRPARSITPNGGGKHASGIQSQA